MNNRGEMGECSEMDLSSRSLNLAFAEYMGDVNLVNTEIKLYQKVSREEIREQAAKIFKEQNCSTLYYLAKKK